MYFRVLGLLQGPLPACWVAAIHVVQPPKAKGRLPGTYSCELMVPNLDNWEQSFKQF